MPGEKALRGIAPETYTCIRFDNVRQRKGKAHRNSFAKDDTRGPPRLHHNPTSSSGEQASAGHGVTLKTSFDAAKNVLLEPEEPFSDHHAAGPEQEVQYEKGGEGILRWRRFKAT